MEVKEYLITLFGCPEAWGATWTSSFDKMLLPHERIALPWAREDIIWTSGDATLERMAFIDWKNKTYFSVDLVPFFHALTKLMGTTERKMIISISELLLIYIAYVMNGKDWQGKVIIYAGDNQNVIGWLDKQQAGNPMARFILRLIRHTQIIYYCGQVQAYIRMYHNETPDYFTRVALEDIRVRAKELGLVEQSETKCLRCLEEVCHRGYAGRAFVYPGQPEGQRKLALQKAEERIQAKNARRLHPLKDGTLQHAAYSNAALYEWRAGCGGYAKAWAAMGRTAWATTAATTPWAIRRILQNGKVRLIPRVPVGQRVDVFSASLSLDLTYTELLKAFFAIQMIEPWWVWMDIPTALNLTQFQEGLVILGYCVEIEKVVTTWFGDPVARSRNVVMAGWTGNSGCGIRGILKGMVKLANPVGFDRIMTHVDETPGDTWLTESDWKVIREPTKVETGRKEYPWPKGKVVHKDTGEERTFYSSKGPMKAPRNSSSVDRVGQGSFDAGLYQIYKGKETGIRGPTSEEIWKGLGFRSEDWSFLQKVKVDQKLAITAALRSATVGLGKTMCLRLTQEIVREHTQGRCHGRAGMCRFMEEVTVAERVRRWLRDWRKNPDEPNVEAKTWWKIPASRASGPVPWNEQEGGATSSTNSGSDAWRLRDIKEAIGPVAGAKTGSSTHLPYRAGGRARIDTMPLEQIIKPRTVPREMQQEMTDLNANWNEQKMKLLLESFAPSTNKQYNRGLERWQNFASQKGQSPILIGGKHEMQEEERLLDFCAHLAINLKRAASTVKQHLMGIRWGHVRLGLGDPLSEKRRIWLLLKALKKKGVVKRKWPVTAQMLRWIKTQLDTRTFDGKVTWAAVNTSWYFLLRISEYAAHGGTNGDEQKILRGMDVTFRKDGMVVSATSEADEVGLHLRSSKADVFNAGEWRNHWKSGEEICPVEALRELAKVAPERFRAGEKSHKPLFRFASGKVLQKKAIQIWLERAAIAQGLPSSKYGNHSLRIGGATALYHPGMSIEVIQRYGRWASQAFQGYLWENSESSKGLSPKMSQDMSSLMATRSRAK